MLKRFLASLLLAVAINQTMLIASNSQESDGTLVPPGVPAQTVSAFNEVARLLNASQYAEAADKAQSVCCSAPQWSEAHFAYGTALLQLGRAKEAIAELNHADALKPGNPKVLESIAMAEIQLGLVSTALVKLRQYIQQHPKGNDIQRVKSMLNGLDQEAYRFNKVTSSKGSDNYLPETLACGAARWRSSDIPITVCVKPGNAVNGYTSAYGDSLRRAFEEWAQASMNRLSFKFVADPNAASIVCQWTSNPAEMGNPLEGGETKVLNDDSGRIVSVNIKLLTRNARVATQPFSNAAVHAICLHELGHALGLLGHSSQPGDVMYWLGSYGQDPEGLSERDKKTLLALYDAGEDLLAKHKPNSEKMSFSGAFSAAVSADRVRQLNEEGIKELDAQHYSQAIGKFSEGLKLDPNDLALNGNLGSTYAEMASHSLVAQKYEEGLKYLQQAASYFVKAKDRADAIRVLKKAVVVAHEIRREVDARNLEVQVKTLEALH